MNHISKPTPGKPAFASLEAIEHSLTFYGGLVATDRPDLFGMDTDARKDVCFEIDTQNELAMIQEAIQVRATMLAALKAADVALGEAADKFWVFHCNAPNPVGTDLASQHRREDKEFMAVKSAQMVEAQKSVRAAISLATGGRG